MNPFVETVNRNGIVAKIKPTRGVPKHRDCRVYDAWGNYLRPKRRFTEAGAKAFCSTDSSVRPYLCTRGCGAWHVTTEPKGERA